VAGDPVWSADFDAADTDHNGVISRAEFDRHQAQIRKKAPVRRR
jgi:hypothetical protein